MTTLDRLSYILKHAKGLVNAEDEPYIAASLGCANGVMRSPAGKGIKPDCDRLDETVASVRFQREAPAFVEGVINESDELLADTCTITDTWFAPALGKKITQYAPAVIARNTSVPHVLGERKPFVTCCGFDGKVYAVATHKRNVDDGPSEVCAVICDNIGAPEKIGVFGRYKSLGLVPSRKIESAVIRSLFDDRTEKIEIADNSRISLSEQTIDSFASKRDNSLPAFVIDVRYKD